MSLIQSYKATQKGFSPLLFQKHWQVAILSYVSFQNIKNIDKVEVHTQTDEVFLLQSGSVILISAQIKNKTISKWEVVLMKPNVIYNIPRDLWHNMAMKKDSSVFIVEKRDTHKNDVQYHSLSKEEISKMRSMVKKEWNNV